MRCTLRLAVAFGCIIAFAFAINEKELTGEEKPSTTDEPQYWQAILGDICQLPGFPRATGDPLRYVECVKQNLDTGDRKDLGIWLLRECLPGYEFVASARRCKTTRSIRRQQQLCDGPKSSSYQFCPTEKDVEFTIQEIRQAPRQCSCPNGENNCVCPTPEILEPITVSRNSKLVRRSPQMQSSQNMPNCPCPGQQTNCVCLNVSIDFNGAQTSTPTVYRDQCCQQQQQPPCQCNDQQSQQYYNPPQNQPESQPPSVQQQPQQQQPPMQQQQPGQLPPPQPQQQQQPQQMQPQQMQPQQNGPIQSSGCVCPTGQQPMPQTMQNPQCVCDNQQQPQPQQQPMPQQMPPQQPQQQPNNCQTTTTQQQYCPQPSNQQPAVVQPQACPLVQGGTQNARYQGICSWMVDPLATDPESKSHFLQCQPAPNNLFCGRWQRMPCAPATVFDASSQVCVWDSSSQAQPGNLPTPAPYVATQPQRDSQCSCTGGVQIGSCNANYQCPGQSVCQVGQQPQQNGQNRPCMVCCYYHKKKMI